MPISILGISKFNFPQKEISEPWIPYLFTVITNIGSQGFVFNTVFDINIEYMIFSKEQYFTGISFLGKMRRCHYDFQEEARELINLHGRTLIRSRPEKRWNFIDDVCGYADKENAHVFYSKPNRLDKIYVFDKLKIGSVQNKICYLQIPCLSNEAFDDFEAYFYD